MTQVTISFDKSTGRYNCSVNGVEFKTSNTSYVEYRYRKITGTKKTFDEICGNVTASEPAQKTEERFDINTRFKFVEQLVKMVASGVQASAVITGQGGLGKSHTVLQTLQAAGFRDKGDLDNLPDGTIIPKGDKSYIQIKGFSTAKGLYRALFENNGSIIVFDDIDIILKDAVALNILKGALDSYGKRIISWNADMRDDDLPRSFNFTGRVIFISNMSQGSIDQAIRSRSMMIDLSMTVEQKLQRMEFLIKSPEFMSDFSMEHKNDALALIRRLAGSARDINLRTLIQVTKIRVACDSNWEAMAEYTICS